MEEIHIQGIGTDCGREIVSEEEKTSLLSLRSYYYC